MTDAIIRPCLNIDGGTDREKGLYANLSNPSHAEIGFQRSTPIQPLEKELKRPPTDEEIEKAKQNPYSVDNVFCPACEDLFTEIENEFTGEILPKLRGGSVRGSALTFSEVKTIRLFAYLQFYRSSICVPEFDLPNQLLEEFRKMIQSHRTLAAEDLNGLPLSITFLETTGKREEFTKNYIAHLRFRNPFTIVMCDLVLQLYESEASVKFQPFFNLNDANFREYLNVHEKEFKVRTLANEGRMTFLKEYTTEIARERINLYATRFVKLWAEITKENPSQEIVSRYLDVLTKDGEENILNYTQSEVTRITTAFVAKLLGINQ